MNSTVRLNEESLSKEFYKPLISVVIATYNSEKYLEQTIKSVICQSYSKYELIIIDGKSNDNTVSIIKKYEDSINYWVSEADNGIYDAWNKAILKSKGQWITFIGSDDMLYPNAFETYINHIVNHSKSKDLEFISSKIDFVDENLNLISTVGEPWDWQRFKKSMITWHVGCFHSRNLFNKYGLFDPSYKISGDYELLLRPREKLMTSYIDERTAIMRNSGISSTKLIEASGEVYRAKISNGILSPLKGKSLKIIDKIRLVFRLRFNKSEM